MTGEKKVQKTHCTNTDYKANAYSNDAYADLWAAAAVCVCFLCVLISYT